MPLPEKPLIRQLRRLAASSPGRSAHATPAGIRTGIGDDCAVLRLPPGRELLVTTDFSLEGVHFRRDWHPAESVGHRCLARGLSDIAAMGGEPIAAFLSLALPRKVPQQWVDRFTKGLLELAGRFGVSLAGGDTAESPTGILADIVVVGTVPKGKGILRSTASAGDQIYVTGELGGSAAAISEMSKLHRKLGSSDNPRHFFPEPRIAVARALRGKGLPSAMIDTSDGLSTDLAHICEESGVGAEVEAEAIPRAIIGKPPRPVDLRLALHGGEDYELLFTAPAGKRIPNKIAGVTITAIGEVTRKKKIVLKERGSPARKLEAKGWQHFS